MKRAWKGAVLAVWLVSAMAAPPALRDQPPPPLPAEGEVPLPEGIEPEVTIRKQGRDTIEEYRIGGRLYMVRVVPAKGRPYYLIDTDGDGDLETRRFELGPEILIPGWVIKSW